jgi:hypothetical protein
MRPGLILLNAAKSGDGKFIIVHDLTGNGSLRIASWNIASNRNYRVIAAKIAGLNIDICAVQEVLVDPAPITRRYWRCLVTSVSVLPDNSLVVNKSHGMFIPNSSERMADPADCSLRCALSLRC